MMTLHSIIEKCSGNDMPFCVAMCPLHVDMPGAIAHIRDGRFDEALRLVRETLPFPGIMGRICTHPCEGACRRKDIDQPVAIMHLKRIAADLGKSEWDIAIPSERTDRVAVVGGGPAGLMAACQLRKLGYRVIIFEAMPVLGGMLAMGIPEYRLPRAVLQRELGIVEKLGIQVRLNARIGESISLSDLRRDFSAIFLAPGTPLSRRVSIDGCRFEGVKWGLDFLKEVNLGQRSAVPDRVVVIGGGNVAVDVALTARRLGAGEVRLVCLESRAEMPAFAWEIQQAVDEGILISTSWGPKRISGDGQKVKHIELMRCVSVFDGDGRFNPVFDGSSTISIDADAVILAIGQAPDTSFLGGSGVETSAAGLIRADVITLATAVPGVFAGGDAVTGPKSAIDALAAGKKAAVSIDRYLQGKDLAAGREQEGPVVSRLKVEVNNISAKGRVGIPTLPVMQRSGNFQEVEAGFSGEEAVEEAARCMSCECKLCVKDCEFLKLYCHDKPPTELVRSLEGSGFREKPKIPYSCNLCGLCKMVCPEELSIGDAFLELRHQLVEARLGPLPSHKYIDWNLDWSNSNSFIFAEPDPKAARCDRVFFPGCSLCGYSPNLVVKTYRYLRQRLPGTGILLHCCGAPRRDLAEVARFRKLTSGIEAGMAKLGASEVIVCCPNCYKTFKNFLPQVQLRSVYEVMEELGLPGDMKTRDWTFSLYDPCTARWERRIQDSVRGLVQTMGYRVEEMKHSRELTRCCGLGGMVPYADIWLAFKVGRRLAEEARHDILTYCASCRESLANSEGAARPSLHILDLIFNPDWEQGRLNPPNIGVTRRQNQAEVKKLLTAEFEGVPARPKRSISG